MPDQISHTQYDDAPLTTAKNPDPKRLAEGDAKASDQVVGRTVTINRPRTELYAFWRNFTNLPLFMHDLESVSVSDSTRSLWRVAAPGDKSVEWGAVITEDIPDRLIAWTSDEGAGVHNSGRVEFRDAPAGRGTEVSATVVYRPPGGLIGKAIAKVFQKEPHIQVRRELRRFKQLMETGEVSTAAPPDAAPRG